MLQLRLPAAAQFFTFYLICLVAILVLSALFRLLACVCTTMVNGAVGWGLHPAGARNQLRLRHRAQLHPRLVVRAYICIHSHC